jgi:hypothetical protein
MTKILFSLLLVLLTGGCAQRSPTGPPVVTTETAWVRHQEWTEKTHFPQWDGVTHGGLGAGFVQAEHRNTHPYQRPSNDLFEIGAEEAFESYLILFTAADQEAPMPVLVSVFVDYEQVVFELDGQEGLLHYAEIEPDKVLEIPMKVALASPGWHDLFVVVFPYPEAHPTDPVERVPPSFVVAGRRTVVCVETCEKSSRPFSDRYVGGPVQTPVHAFAYAYPLLPGESQNPFERLLLTHTKQPGEPLDLELWAKNPHDYPMEYAVLPLLNFQQVPFDAHVGSTTMLFSLPAQSEMVVPGQLGPLDSGVHELQVVVIFNPYEHLDRIDAFVTSDMRAAIIVAP